MKLFLLMVILFSYQVSAQNTWHLKIDKEDIKVYNRSAEGSKINEIKVEVSYACGVAEIVAAVMDVPNHKRWSYATKSGYVVKDVAPGEIIFYKEIDSPFPVSNRDLVARMTVTQNPETRVVKIVVKSLKGYVDIKDGLVRVPLSDETWLLTPKADNTVLVDYYLQVDPGGAISAFLVNAFATKGPFETFKTLKEEIELRKTSPVSFSFLKAK